MHEIYCHKCGEKNNSKRYPTHYDPETGTQQYAVEYTCPSGKCNHTGHAHYYLKKNWNPYSRMYKCDICGDEADLGGYD